MKPINVQSLLQAKDSLDENGFGRFLDHYGIEVREAEIRDLGILLETLFEVGCNIGLLSKFYVGYKIPQISKEFDLLRFGTKSIINIELKNNGSEERIKKQLIRNKYYLNFIGKKIFAFTFVSLSKKLYFLDGKGDLVEIGVAGLVELLTKQGVDESAVPDAMFNPSDYLVSPFNSTERFLAGEYFLTHQQEEVRVNIIEGLKSNGPARFFSIVGGAGTGKTLLIYDIARSLIGENKKPLIVHCGQLNGGQRDLATNGWTITAIRNYNKYSFVDYDLVIVDEAQRIYTGQLDAIVASAKKAGRSCIFSHDKLQTLANWEKKNDISSRIVSIKNVVQYTLSEKIRTNKEIAAFIKMLFDKTRTLPISSKENIEINYFNEIEDARSYLASLDGSGWEILRFTPSQYRKEHHEKYSEEFNRTAHEVIGQEFDGVVVAIDGFFSYSESGELVYMGDAYYDPPKMLFQNLTRCRKKLNLVIIRNEEVLDRCISILGNGELATTKTPRRT